MATEEEASSLREDLDELRSLESIAKRPRVLSFLSSEIRSLDAKLSSAAAAAAASETVSPVSVVKAPVTAAVNYVPLSSFSWDQDNDKVTRTGFEVRICSMHYASHFDAIRRGIYIFLEGVDQEKIETVFKPTSIDVKFHDVDGKNYRCAISKLNKEILPDKCKVLVKPKRVIITLPKASKGNWLDLHAKEDKIKPSMDKDKDPMAGIMDLMKNMYEEGDDDMKRMIAKSWSEARTGKTADPPKGFN